jgi:hypothetical protein
MGHCRQSLLPAPWKFSRPIGTKKYRSLSQFATFHGKKSFFTQRQNSRRDRFIFVLLQAILKYHQFVHSFVCVMDYCDSFPLYDRPAVCGSRNINPILPHPPLSPLEWITWNEWMNEWEYASRKLCWMTSKTSNCELVIPGHSCW